MLCGRTMIRSRLQSGRAGKKKIDFGEMSVTREPARHLEPGATTTDDAIRPLNLVIT